MVTSAATATPATADPRSWFQKARDWSFGVDYKGGQRWSSHFSRSEVIGRLREGGFAIGPNPTIRGSLREAAAQGGLSAVLPYAPPVPSAAKQASTGALSLLPKSAQGAVRWAGRTALKWIGPLSWGYRMATEVPGATQGRGIVGGIASGIDKTVRITGEEVLWSATAGLGMAAGGMIGGPVGMVAGFALGAIGGYLGSKAWNSAVDIAEAPYKMAYGAYNFLKQTGIRNKRLELGGVASLGNSTYAAATMRQRALGEIYRSGINQRSILGREAQYMHLR